MCDTGRTKGTAQSANPPEMDTNVDRTVVLGGEPVETVCGVNKGNSDFEYQTRIQQTNLLCKETCQCNGNVENNIPSAYGLPLKGEWSVYPSSELEMLVIMSIELEDPDSSEIPCVHLRGMSWQTGDVNRPGNQADGIESQTDMSSWHSDMPSIKMNANKPADTGAIIRIPQKKEKLPDIPVEAAWQHSDEPNGFGDATDALSMSTDRPSIKTNLTKPANKMGNVRMHRINLRTRNSPETPKIAMAKPIS